MHSLLTKATREVVVALLFFLPSARRIRMERWLRGREEVRRLARADVAVVSFGKSGRTWLRVMMSHYYQLYRGLPRRSLIGFDNVHRRTRSIPRILFSHDNYIKDYAGNFDSKTPFYDRKVVLLVRDPRDVAVSLYFQWKHRMRRSKKRLNRYPPHGSDCSIFDFVMNPDCGLPRIIAFLNVWAKEAVNIERLLVVRYEDMRDDPATALRRIMEFVDEAPADEAAIEGAVTYTTVENMRRLEEENFFWLAGGRLRPGVKGDADSYKVRRAKVGGYCDYFNRAEVARIEEMVLETLLPDFGYEPDRATGRADSHRGGPRRHSTDRSDAP